MKEFTGTTYEEWLEYHYRVSGPAIVKALIEMNLGAIKKERD